MPLAGRMKLKHFLLLTGGLVVAGGAAGVALYEPPEDTVPEIAVVETPTAPDTPDRVATPPATPTPPAVPAEPALPVEDQAQAVVLGYRGQDLGTSKKKDVTKGKAFKVNVYQDDGNATANRAKVDLDRDDQWDQKYTFHDDGTVSVKTATADDENYDVEETLAL